MQTPESFLAEYGLEWYDPEAEEEGIIEHLNDAFDVEKIRLQTRHKSDEQLKNWLMYEFLMIKGFARIKDKKLFGKKLALNKPYWDYPEELLSYVDINYIGGEKLFTSISLEGQRFVKNDENEKLLEKMFPEYQFQKRFSPVQAKSKLVKKMRQLQYDFKAETKEYEEKLYHLISDGLFEIYLKKEKKLKPKAF